MLEAKQRLLPGLTSLGSSAMSRPGAMLLILGLLASYLIIAPVWSPRLLWWRYDNARLLEIALLVTVGAMTALPAISRTLYHSWVALGRVPRVLLMIFLAFGAFSVATSNVPQVGSLQLSLVLLLAASHCEKQHANNQQHRHHRYCQPASARPKTPTIASLPRRS